MRIQLFNNLSSYILHYLTISCPKTQINGYFSKLVIYNLYIRSKFRHLVARNRKYLLVPQGRVKYIPRQDVSVAFLQNLFYKLEFLFVLDNVFDIAALHIELETAIKIGLSVFSIPLENWAVEAPELADFSS